MPTCTPTIDTTTFDGDWIVEIQLRLRLVQDDGNHWRLVLFNAWHKTKKGKVLRREDFAHGMEFKTWNGGENSGNWSFKAFDFLPDTDLVGVLEWDPGAKFYRYAERLFVHGHRADDPGIQVAGANCTVYAP